MEMPPEVRLGLIAAAVVGTIAILLLVFGDRPELAATIRRMIAGEALPLMSKDEPEKEAAAGMEPVYIPVLETGMEPAGMHATLVAAPDMGAVNTDMPRISRDITNEELIVLLAVLRGPDRKPRFSANKIADLVGGDRNRVMAQIKELRTGPPSPVYPPLNEVKQRVA